ncbi:hypothetical protein DFH06DRAFT_325585 [Mycena polygramma]|nr:hypothetical protein DFH06DRAFT_325585 [Mycena polygramma]
MRHHFLLLHHNHHHPMASSSHGHSHLASLPPELLDEIVSHYPASFSFLSPLARQEHVPQRLVRQQALRSLSQSCVHLRRVFLPLLWEHLEISARNPSFEYKYVGAESELAELFCYIKSIHISLQHWTDKESIFLFVQFLRTLPTLTGLQIYHAVPWAIAPVVNYAFSTGAHFPLVTELSLPEAFDGVFPAFPNLRTLAGAALTLGPKSRILDAAQRVGVCATVEALGGLRTLRLEEDGWPELNIKALAAAFPRVRALSITVGRRAPRLQAFRPFTHLVELELVFRPEKANENKNKSNDGDDATEKLDEDPLDALIAAGLAVLRSSQGEQGRRVLRVWTDENVEGPRIVYVGRC